MKPKHLYDFGPYRLDASERVLLRDGKPLSLRPKDIDTLIVLVQNHGHIVDKDELMAKVWPDAFVEEGNLARHITELRRALGDDRNGRGYIETISRRGYRFIAEVKEWDELPSVSAAKAGVETDEAAPVRQQSRTALLLVLLAAVAYFTWQRLQAPAPAPSGPAAPARALLVVLPFDNYSGDPQQEYQSDGLTEELITQLGGMNPQQLGVIARTSAMTYKGGKKPVDQIGRELNADYVLEGSVRRSAERVRVSAQLIRVRDQTHLWAHSFERDVGDIILMQNDVAGAVAHHVQVTLAPGGADRRLKHVDPEAHDLYLKGRYFWNQRTPQALRKSMDYYQEAIRKQPDYAPPYVGLADSELTLAGWEGAASQRQAALRARGLAIQALELDETLAEAHVTLAMIYYLADWNVAAAEREFRRAFQLNPNYALAHQWYALLLAWTGRLEEAMQANGRALELDPFSLNLNAHRAGLLIYAHRYDAAIAQARKTLALDPDFPLAHANLAVAELGRGNHEAAIGELRKAVELAQGDAGYKAVLAHAYARAGRTVEARRLLAEITPLATAEGASSPQLALVDVAGVHAGLGAKQEALHWLEKAYAEHDNALLQLLTDYRFLPLRSEPRFQDLVRRVGLPQVDP